MSRRTSAITAPGIVLSQPTRQTRPSKRWPRATSSIESAITSREIERGAHAGRAHRDAVRDGDRVELDRRAARRADAVLDVPREHALVQVARHRLDPGRRDADERLREVLVGEADAFSIARAGARSTPSVSAALRRLAGSVGLVVDAHRAALLVSATSGAGRGVGGARCELGGDRGAVRPSRPRRRPTGRSRTA